MIYCQYLVVAHAFWFCEHGTYQTSFKTIFVPIQSYKSTLNTTDHRPGEGGFTLNFYAKVYIILIADKNFLIDALPFLAESLT